MSSPFISALTTGNKDRIPMWFMRQAGRYLPEYQALRKKYDFRTMSHTPELVCETTLTPFARYDLDAAILFSDILTCLEFMGSTFHFGEEGPTLKDHGSQVLEHLRPLNPAKDMAFVGEGIRQILKKLNGVPLIGFAGAPFTLLSYLVEGSTSREFSNTRHFMYAQPEKFVKAMDLLSDSVADYLLYQFECGASAVQLFDSWVGILPHSVYQKLIYPSMARLLTKVRKAGKPVILYSQPTFHLLPSLQRLEPNALSVDWRTSLAEVVERLKADGRKLPTLQGNLDPLVTTLPWEQARPYVAEVLETVTRLGIRDRYIFNVGHGVLPETRWETLGEIVKFVHEYKA